MNIETVKNEYGATVYHVRDGDCIQEFWTRKEAQEFIDYFQPIFTKTDTLTLLLKERYCPHNKDVDTI
jgi:hypothetical protein